MFDCVYPTRTARFGVALYTHGTLRLKAQQYGQDLMAIEANCPCICCRPSRCQTNNNNDNSNNNNNSRSASDSTTNTVTAPTATRPAVTRAALHAMFKDNSELACQLLTQHNLCYMMRLLRNMRMAILQGRERYGAFIRQFLLDLFVFLDGKIRKAKPTGPTTVAANSEEPKYIRYTPNPNLPGSAFRTSLTSDYSIGLILMQKRELFEWLRLKWILWSRPNIESRKYHVEEDLPLSQCCTLPLAA
jgi:hypothetical protein